MSINVNSSSSGSNNLKNKNKNNTNNKIKIYTTKPSELSLIKDLLDGGLKIFNDNKSDVKPLSIKNAGQLINPTFFNSEYFKKVFSEKLLMCDNPPSLKANISKPPPKIKVELIEIDVKTISLYWYIFERVTKLNMDWNCDNFINNIPETVNKMDIIKYFGVKSNKQKISDKINFSKSNFASIIGNSYFETCDTSMKTNLIFVPLNTQVLNLIFRNSQSINSSAIYDIDNKYYVAIPTSIYLDKVLSPIFIESVKKWSINQDNFI